MEQQLGLGAMLQLMCGGPSGAAQAYDEAIGKVIESVTLDNDFNDNDGGIIIRFTDGTGLALYDCARSCCESRYLSLDDDDVPHIIGGKFLGLDVVGGDIHEDQYGECSESEFVVIQTTKGEITFNAYNDHNGYYGGILLSAKALD